MQEIKLFGETHNSDSLLEAYHNIFINAQKEGYKTCFVEIQPRWQKKWDKLVEEVAAWEHSKLLSVMERLAGDYRLTADQKKLSEIEIPERSALGQEYMRLLSALTGIKLVCVDVAFSPLRALLMNDASKINPTSEFQALPKVLEEIDVDELVDTTGREPDEIKAVLKDIENENEELFRENWLQEMRQRFSDDVAVANFIMSRLEGTPALVIYGKYHVEYGRADSIAGTLAVQKNLKAYCYYILGNEIAPRPGELQPAYDEYPSFAEISAEAMTGNPEALIMAAEKGHPPSQYGLAELYANGKGLPVDHPESLWWLTEAAKRGFLKAQVHLAFRYADKKNIYRNYPKAFLWAAKAAEQGDVDAQCLLAELYYKGLGTAKDDVQSHVWYFKAAEAGDVIAQATVAYNYYKGCGVTADLTLSFMWYSIAAANGDKDATGYGSFVRKKLTEAQMAEAERRASQWLSQKPSQGVIMLNTA